MTLGNPNIDRCYEKMNSISFLEHLHGGIISLMEKVGTKTRTLLLATALSITPTASMAQERTLIIPDTVTSLGEEVRFATLPDYRGLLGDAFYGEQLQLPTDIDTIFIQYVTPLWQVLADKGLGDILTGEDVANIVVLAMMKQQGDSAYQEQYKYVAASFPNPDIDIDFRVKLRELFGEK